MASGTISLGSSGYLTGQIVWSSSSNGSSKNTSTVTASLQVKRTNSYTTTGTWTGSLNIGGTVEEFSIHKSVTNNWITLKSFNITKAHSADGSGTCYIYGKASAPTGTSLGGNSVSGSKTVTLDTIPRAATITSAINFNDEGKPKINFSNPAGTAATISVGVFWDSSTALIPYETISSTATSKEWTLTTAQKNAIYSKMSTVKSKTVYYYIKTVIGNNTFYNKLAKTLSITNATPTLAPTAVEQTDDNGINNIAATGSNMRWLKGISDISYAFNAAGVKGASIKTYSVKCGSKTGSASSGVLYNIENKDVEFTVTDSRGNTATKTVSGALVNYIRATCSLSVSTALDTSTTAKATISVSGNYFNGYIKTTPKNSLRAWYRFKLQGGSYSAWTSITPTISGNSYTINYTVPDSLGYKNTYVFQARVQDDFNLANNGYIYSSEITVNTLPVFDWGKDDFNFNVPVKFSGDEWHNLTYADNFKNYSDNAVNQAKYKVCGNMVFVCGVFTPKEAFTSGTDSVTFATGIPAEYRPQIAQHTICQGSGINKWLLSVGTSGSLTIARYGTTATGVTVNPGTWLPFSFTYMI